MYTDRRLRRNESFMKTDLDLLFQPAISIHLEKENGFKMNWAYLQTMPTNAQRQENTLHFQDPTLKKFVLKFITA